MSDSEQNTTDNTQNAGREQQNNNRRRRRRNAPHIRVERVLHFIIPNTMNENNDQAEDGTDGPGQFFVYFEIPLNFNLGMDEMEEILNLSFLQGQQTRAAPTATEAFQKLPTIKFTEERKQFLESILQNQNSIEDCGVCLEKYAIGDELILLPCRHAFHKDCLTPWLKEHNTCPTCRFELPIEDPEQDRQRQIRMTEKFTAEGLRIMEVGNEVESIFDQLESVKTQVPAQSLQIKTELLSQLSNCDSFLQQRIVELDKLTNFQNDKIRQNKKNEVVKIQFLQGTVEELTKQISEQTIVEDVKPSKKQRRKRQREDSHESERVKKAPKIAGKERQSNNKL